MPDFRPDEGGPDNKAARVDAPEGVLASSRATSGTDRRIIGPPTQNPRRTHATPGAGALALSYSGARCPAIPPQTAATPPTSAL
eukprot:scaffold13501_cov112-Isochrysis_galbana.AAC.1